MAVQAQYPSNIHLFNRNSQEAKSMLGNNDYSLPGSGASAGGGLFDQSHMFFTNNNGVGINPRKRTREVAGDAPTSTLVNMNSLTFGVQSSHHNHNNHYQQQSTNQQQHQMIEISQLHQQRQQQVNGGVSTGLKLSFGEQNQQLQQQQQRPTLLSLPSDDFALQLKRQSDELTYILHAQGEQLRRTLAEKTERHYRALISAAEEALVNKLKEKEAEIEKAVIKSAELEARWAQLSLEAQTWRTNARAQEAQAVSLQAQIQAHNAQQHERDATGIADGGGEVVEDSESVYGAPVVSDKRVRSGSPGCRVCGDKVASVVILPCRHLCVCRECDDVVHACPVCLSMRTASVEVFLT